ncbi:response regulator [Microvirga vignae]|uniref:response regulator n=1 Tax=Microvirga vignae TaxID=1225564 RepID=UPI00069C686F|nr:response regulator [Microvirga vignae]
MSATNPQRILIADNNPDFRGRLAHCLRTRGHDVITAEAGERAFVALHDWSRPIDWLYTRAAPPGLIDGWILVDEYHETHQNRAVIISGSEARISSQGDIVLKQPIPPRRSKPFLVPFLRLRNSNQRSAQ